VAENTAKSIEPIFVSVKDAAQMLGLSTWEVYTLTSGDDPAIKVSYKGRRKLVHVDSVRDYAANLPTMRADLGAAS